LSSHTDHIAWQWLHSNNVRIMETLVHSMNTKPPLIQNQTLSQHQANSSLVGFPGLTQTMSGSSENTLSCRH
jgi:hypothetical protein